MSRSPREPGNPEPDVVDRTVDGHPTFPPVGQLKIPPPGVSLWIDGDEGIGSSSLPQGCLFPVVGAVGAVGNGDGFCRRFPQGKRGPELLFTADLEVVDGALGGSAPRRSGTVKRSATRATSGFKRVTMPRGYPRMSCATSTGVESTPVDEVSINARIR